MARAQVSGAEIVERFLASMAAHDWDAMAACLVDDGFVRLGPYGDAYRSKPGYVAFIAELLPTLPGYVMEVARVTDAAPVIVVELSETVDDAAGTPLRTPEALVFELAPDGRIRRVEVFIRQDEQD